MLFPLRKLPKEMELRMKKSSVPGAWTREQNMCTNHYHLLHQPSSFQMPKGDMTQHRRPTVTYTDSLIASHRAASLLKL